MKNQEMSEPLQIPFAFPGRAALAGRKISVLAGDVGGTKTNLAWYDASQAEITLIRQNTFHSSAFGSCLDMLKEFLQQGQPEAVPDRICLGVAGPVVQGSVEVTNLPWKLDEEEIRQATGVKAVTLLNDLEVTAYGLAGLGPDGLLDIRVGNPHPDGNMAILAPGTGLGEAGLFWDGSCYHPFATEGGHADFSPRSDLDLELYQFLGAKYPVVSWEKVIAGPGIHDLFSFLLEKRKRTAPAWLSEALKKEDPSAVISQSALEEKDATCQETMQVYVRLLARESANLVLKLKATGGLFLGGGIPPKISSLLQFNVFYDNFLDCDRMQHLLKNIPIRIILSDKTALLGAAWHGAYGGVGN